MHRLKANWLWISFSFQSVKFLEQCVDMLVLFNCVYEDVCDALQGQREISVVNQKQHTQIVFLSLGISGSISTNTWWDRQSRLSLPQWVLRVSVSEIVPGGIHKGVHGVCFSLRRPFTPDINRRKSVSAGLLDMLRFKKHCHLCLHESQLPEHWTWS